MPPPLAPLAIGVPIRKAARDCRGVVKASGQLATLGVGREKWSFSGGCVIIECGMEQSKIACECRVD
eukprot:8856-Prorocentrum_minimum.AAC.1